MIIDGNGVYSDKVAVVSGNSSVVDAGARGDAHVQPYLVVTTTLPLTAAQGLSVEVQTSSDSTFGAFDTLCIFTAKKGDTQVITSRMPKGLKQYTRLKFTVTGTVSGTMDAFLTDGISSK